MRKKLFVKSWPTVGTGSHTTTSTLNTGFIKSFDPSSVRWYSLLESHRKNYSSPSDGRLQRLSWEASFPQQSYSESGGHKGGDRFYNVVGHPPMIRLTPTTQLTTAIAKPKSKYYYFQRLRGRVMWGERPSLGVTELTADSPGENYFSYKRRDLNT